MKFFICFVATPTCSKCDGEGLLNQRLSSEAFPLHNGAALDSDAQNLGTSHVEKVGLFSLRRLPRGGHQHEASLCSTDVVALDSHVGNVRQHHGRSMNVAVAVLSFGRFIWNNSCNQVR